MKKALLAVIASSMCFSLASCGSASLRIEKEGFEESVKCFNENLAKTFEQDNVRVGLVDDYREEKCERAWYVTGRKCYSTEYIYKRDERTGIYTNYLLKETWTFIDEFGRKVTARRDYSSETAGYLERYYYTRDVKAYENFYKSYEKYLKIPETLDESLKEIPSAYSKDVSMYDKTVFDYEKLNYSNLGEGPDYAHFGAKCYNRNDRFDSLVGIAAYIDSKTGLLDNASFLLNLPEGCTAFGVENGIYEMKAQFGVVNGSGIWFPDITEWEEAAEIVD